MIKGVNKQVLEINETQTGFFEKAIFFVKPEYTGMSEGKLRESAGRELEHTGKPPLKKSNYKKATIKTILAIICPFVIGVISGIAISTLF